MRSFEDAFDGLYGLAYRVAFRLLGDRAAAEDAAQEALARACARWQRVDEYAEAWVSRVAANFALDVHRRNSRPLAPPPIGAAADVHAAERIDLQRALKSLSRRQREVVVLRYLADLSEEDVMRALGCSIGAVKQHAHRGLERLRQLMATVPAERL